MTTSGLRTFSRGPARIVQATVVDDLPPLVAATQRPLRHVDPDHQP